ncbi:conserved protein of unknown function [Rhodovastum atsumiense]|uniref:Uncharacterized protein n=1 Tax=Rhodovastum atsumiense TaxID=504468 RepID=A0A5M6IIW0_9PROT|nr:hypothetical protein [Rhodovastum atsumiense]KAA5608181.1 hypothetical protein F1189_30280 [Rhodovastum atsumiense]CAH2602547.1 conserved protein of unknown function [Rhodovastum atsumiense]
MNFLKAKTPDNLEISINPKQIAAFVQLNNSMTRIMFSGQKNDFVDIMKEYWVVTRMLEDVDAK